MTNPAYSFLPWLRHGIGTAITTADLDPSVKLRAQVDVGLTLSGDRVGGGTPLTAAISQSAELYGPGDIVGVHPSAVIRTDPQPWITAFEGNYLAAIDFHDPDFPWRYTPAAPDGSGLRLRPWLAVAVLRDDEFTDVRATADRPLPSITIKDSSHLPPAEQLWAWAHVHVNELLSADPHEIVSPDTAAVGQRLEAALAGNRDLAYSRIMCPRRLDDNTAYQAFLIPTFESGRLAGLGLDPTTAPHATFSAWAGYSGRPVSGDHPVYYRWSFRTGSHGDFEYLVSLLRPQPVDPRVGIRDIDVTDPGSNIPGIDDPALHGVLRLGGALRVPDDDLSPDELAARQRDESWDTAYPVPFQKALAAFVNLPDDYAVAPAANANAATGLGPGVEDDPDPLITAPLYGRWHALTQRLLTDRNGAPLPNPRGWVHSLNLDPRFRVPAAFGARVVEDNSESYLDDAWQQIGDVLAANQRIREIQLAVGTAMHWHADHLAPLATRDPERALSILGPVARRVITEGVTMQHLRSTSLVPPVYTSIALRRVVRPGSRTMRTLPFAVGAGDTGVAGATGSAATTATASPANLMARVNAGQVSAAAPRTVPAGIATVDRAAAAAADPDIPKWALWLTGHAGRLTRALPWLLTLILILAVIAAVVLGLVLSAVAALIAAAAALAIATAVLSVITLLRRARRSAARVRSLTEETRTPASVADLPTSSDFRLSAPGSSFTPSRGGPDSEVAQRFKAALRDSYALTAATRAANVRPEPVALDLTRLVATGVAGVTPTRTIPARGLSNMRIPQWLLDLVVPAPDGAVDEVMAYPKIDLPMYEPLKAKSVELFLPNINLIPPDSVTLVETNQPFIESYMVGLNHEFARKLLWHEFMTDQRGSYFRQFWDVNSYIDSEGLSENPLREKLYDIPEIHRWAAPSPLGAHNNRVPGGGTSAQAVLVIRGELLKKYPNAVIYAHHAKWKSTHGRIEPDAPRDFDDLSAADLDNPPRDKVRSPLYEAKADPDIYFFGFDLTIAEAKGGSGQNQNDDAGWFFVIKERPGEPRFGLEADAVRPRDTFNELTWNDAMPGGAPGAFLQADSLGHVTLVPLPPDPEPGHVDQQAEDTKANDAQPSAARWAYLLFRAPVLVAVHAEKMLRSP